MPLNARIAYFSMEIALEESIPSYSGGLGVLAGDTLKAAADLSVPVVAVSLLYHKGYFIQELDAAGNQIEHPVLWRPEDKLKDLGILAKVEIEGRIVHFKVWRYTIKGESGFEVPVLFLDSRVDVNTPEDQALSDALYAGDQLFRLRQEALLGMGGVCALDALGYSKLARYHMNEGHAALLTLPLLEKYDRHPAHTGDKRAITQKIRQHCVFTTHTPVAAGHDHFSAELAERVLGTPRWNFLKAFLEADSLHMTHVALHLSGYSNAVSLRHSHVSRELFPGYPIHSITNGVHALTWTARPFQELFDRQLPEWRKDASALRDAGSLSGDDIWKAHIAAKTELFRQIKSISNMDFDPHVLTIGFARRSTPYKRMMLLFSDIERLNQIAERCGKLQLVFAGKSHPHDHPGKDLIRGLFERSKGFREQIKIVYLPNYDVKLAHYICSGVDLWLNTPRPPWEASGTSGMKAALNGVPSLSTLDGWWVEGCIQGVTGWGIGHMSENAVHHHGDLDPGHADQLYRTLEHDVFPLFYERREKFIEIMTNAIAINGSYFNTHRMVAQYRMSSYRL